MKTFARAVSLIGAFLGVSSAHAVLIGGVDFPQGNASFADSVVSFAQGSGVDNSAFSDPTNALGPPDVNTTNGLACFQNPTTSNCKFVSLGDGGVLVLHFTDNVLTGSSPSGSVTGVGDGIPDLYEFEVGVAEAFSVDISKDGTSWTNVGQISGGGSGIGVFVHGIDIDKFGFGTSDRFTYVRLTDLLIDPGTSPAGADIDAVGAIETVVPLPGAAWLLTGAVALLARRVRTSSSDR